MELKTIIKSLFPYMLKESCGVNLCKREIPIVVNLTFDDENYNSLSKTIYSMLDQSLKPDRVILWLDNNSYDLMSLPYEVTRYIKNGLEIRFVKNIGLYTKTVYALKEFSESIVVTVDNNIFYPSDWLKKLYLSYISHEEDIHVHRSNTNEESASYKNRIIGLGGVLYPPKCFSNEVMREDIFIKNAPHADDVWFWVMALVHKRKIRVVKNHIKFFVHTNFKRKVKNDESSLDNLMRFYGQNINTLFK